MAKRIVPNLYIAVQDESEIETLSDNQYIKDILFNSVILGIEEAVKGRKKEATVIELNSSGNYISIPKNKWEESLTNAEQYFIKLEEYETCADIQKLKESIKSYGSQRVSRKTTTPNRPNNRNRKYLKAS
jgi:hypothetical protein